MSKKDVGPGLQCAGGSGHARPDPEPCNTDGWSDISDPDVQNIFKNPTLKRQLEDLIASSIAQNLEKMAVLIPLESGRPGAYSFNLVGTDIGTVWTSSACHMDVSLPNLPSGSILVHTHPFSSNEQTCNGQYYEPGPSEPDDWDALEGWGADKGIILDKESIISYEENASGSEEVSSESTCL